MDFCKRKGEPVVDDRALHGYAAYLNREFLANETLKPGIATDDFSAFKPEPPVASYVKPASGTHAV